MSNVSTLSQPLIPVNTSVDAKVDGGTYTYVVSGPPQGQALSVTISVPGAPQASSWSVTGAWTGSMQGSNSFGPLYLTAGGSLTVTGSSVSDPGPLQVTGVQGPLGSLQPSTPTSVGPSVEVGTVDATITGTVDANITNANLPVSGSVDANITNATLQIAGTVDIAANQVVQVENTAGGSVTVAGTVDINSVAGTVTIDANGSDVTVDAVGVGALLATITTGSGSFAVPSGVNTLIITAAGTIGSPPKVSFAQGTATIYVPVSPVANSDGSTTTWVAMVPVPATYTVANLPSGTVYVYSSTGIERVEAAVVQPNFRQASIVVPVVAGSYFNSLNTAAATSFTYAPTGGTTYATIRTTAAITSITYESGPVAYHLLSFGGSTYVYGFAVLPEASYTVNLASSVGTAITEYAGTTHIDPAPLQTVSVPNPAAGADWSFALPYPAKVTAVGAELVSASGGSNPTLSVGPITLYWETGTLAAGTYYLKAWPGPPALAVVSQFGNILLAIPDLGVLPAGTVIAASGQAAADQWSSISVLLEPA